MIRNNVMWSWLYNNNNSVSGGTIACPGYCNSYRDRHTTTNRRQGWTSPVPPWAQQWCRILHNNDWKCTIEDVMNIWTQDTMNPRIHMDFTGVLDIAMIPGQSIISSCMNLILQKKVGENTTYHINYSDTIQYCASAVLILQANTKEIILSS